MSVQPCCQRDKLIYLGSPYTHSEPAVMQSRFDAVCVVAAKLMSEGYLIFSPIAHTHPIALAGDLPRGFGYWERYDRTMLDAAAELWVLCLPGWEDSVGLLREMDYMRASGKPICFLDRSGQQEAKEKVENRRKP